MMAMSARKATRRNITSWAAFKITTQEKHRSNRVQFKIQYLGLFKKMAEFGSLLAMSLDLDGVPLTPIRAYALSAERLAR
jgi:hypothetical protein